jgi:hypothetical protein
VWHANNKPNAISVIIGFKSIHKSNLDLTSVRNVFTKHLILTVLNCQPNKDIFIKSILQEDISRTNHLVNHHYLKKLMILCICKLGACLIDGRKLQKLSIPHLNIKESKKS